ncbi:MAG TPA: ATP synthase F0 subunit B [Patescibacteria group bacterium]|nr:ATP synthase F0 subunit B [Patescibacteria group bacterium]
MEALGIDYKLLIAQLINFGIFFLIFKKYIAKHFFGFLKEQKKQAQEKEKILEDLKDKEEKLQEKERKLIQETQSRAEYIIEEAKTAAIKVKEELLQKAHEEIEHLKKQEKTMREEEKQQLYKEAKMRTLQTSELLVRSVLKDFFNEKEQEIMTQRLLDKLKHSPSSKGELYEN